ncbi:hypothetical protein ACJJIX_13155 [Microbulbifer sp. VAAC004]|uniref:hypothetical protein n=1 Tax=unclassified Microbulbifer TaxID=2619833 RepID=UPI00403A43B5
MKLYENVIIGNFLYGLGHAIGSEVRNKETLSVINLLQQTPADKELGDVLLEYPGIVRLIEFKNRSGSFKKEKRRHSQLKAALGNNIKYKNISKSIHWYVETESFDECCVNNIKPYLEAFDDEIKSRFTLETFIEEIKQDVIHSDSIFSRDDYKDYLSLVSRCQGTGEVGTGGIVIAVSEKRIKYFQFTNIMQLRLQHKAYVNKIKKQLLRNKEMEISINRRKGQRLEPGL